MVGGHILCGVCPLRVAGRGHSEHCQTHCPVTLFHGTSLEVILSVDGEEGKPGVYEWLDAYVGWLVGGTKKDGSNGFCSSREASDANYFLPGETVKTVSTSGINTA
jgi:hypothetical protein